MRNTVFSPRFKLPAMRQSARSLFKRHRMLILFCTICTFCNKRLQSYIWWWFLGVRGYIRIFSGDGCCFVYTIVYWPNYGVLDRIGERGHVILDWQICIFWVSNMQTIINLWLKGISTFFGVLNFSTIVNWVW